MRKIILKTPLFILFILCCIAGPAFGQKFSDPNQYMNYIGEQFNTLNEDLWIYVRTASHSKNVRKIEEKRKELIRNANLVKNRIKRLPDYEGDASYRDSVVVYLEITYNVLTNDFAEIVDMEQIAEKSYDVMEAYLETKKQANIKLDNAANTVMHQQDIFAAQHGIIILDKHDKVGEKLTIATKVYDYYNEIYLLFFKCYLQEVEMLTALGNEDISGMEQSRKSLIQCANNGILILETITPYEEDNSVIISCQKLLKFYENEAHNELAFFSEFLLTRDKLESLKKIMDNKKTDQITSSEANEYNTLANQFNLMVAEFNRNTDDLNDTRNDLIDEWNKTSDKFINKHVP